MSPRACGFIVFRRLRQQQQQRAAVEFLLLQTSYGGNHWTPPKGHVDPGENDLQTALRETHEEAGLGSEHLLLIPGFQHVMQYNVPKRNGGGVNLKTVVYLLAELKGGTEGQAVTLSHEHVAYRWCDVDEACCLAKFQEMQEALRSAHTTIVKEDEAGTLKK
uniref:Bis(5'-nucleosyl)-tetraphosphatase [asymmetrical] n=1 Tax=Petromyzon marinus TaxID=7757 RepID=A0AAJ7SVU3_PETMA|nr:bis(5'-nucleosyl)-tetraphosphatase [asymmetrical] [Petromyzon marinus]